MGSHPYQLRLITLCKLHTQMVATLDWRIFPVDALDHCLIIWPAEEDLQRKRIARYNSSFSHNASPLTTLIRFSSLLSTLRTR